MPERLKGSSTTSNFNLPGFKHYEVLVGPDPGGKRENASIQENTIVLVRPNQQSSGTIEFQPPFDANKYLADVARLQRLFNHRLGITVDEEGIIRNYNPVLARAMYETLQTEEERVQFKKYEAVQIEKALRERYHVTTSVVFYEIDGDSKLRSKDLKTLPFEQVLQIGIEYYKSLGSPDVNRLEKERVCFLTIQEYFTNPEALIGSKAKVISGPGLVEGTIFTDNFFDDYELIEDSITKKRRIKMIRHASGFTYDQYKEEVMKQNPNYFDEASGPIDEYFLSNPIFTDFFFAERKNALNEKGFQEILQKSQARINHLVETICAPIFTPDDVKEAHNAVLNGADYIWEELKDIKEKIINGVTRVIKRVIPIFNSFAEEINWLGHQAVRAVSAGCGLSGGFSIGDGIGSSIRAIIGSISSFISGALSGLKGIMGGLFGKSEWYCVKCGACGEYINCVVKPGERCPKPSCNAVRQCG